MDWENINKEQEENDEEKVENDFIESMSNSEGRIITIFTIDDFAAISGSINRRKDTYTNQELPVLIARQPGSQIQKKDVPKLSSDTANANSLEFKLQEDWQTNQCRLKFLMDLLYHVIKCAAPKIPERVWKTNALTRMIYSIYHDQLKLVIEPYNALNKDGDISLLIERLPQQLNLFAYGRKPNIVKAAFLLISQFVHLREHRPDVLRQMASIGKSLSELFIEHHNSVLARAMSKLSKDIDTLRTESIRIQMRRDDRDEMKTVLHCDPNGALRQKAREGLVTRNDSEVVTQITRFEEGGKLYSYVLKLATDWFIPLLKSYAATQLPPRITAAFDSHRPLENERDALPFHYGLFNKSIKTILDSEKSASKKPKPPAAALPHNCLSFFLSSQTMDSTLYPVIKYLSTRPSKYAHKLPAQVLRSGNKPELVSRLYEILPRLAPDQSPAGVSDSAVKEFKEICQDQDWTYNNVEFRAVITPREQNEKKRSFKEIEKDCQSSDRSIEVISSAKYVPNSLSLSFAKKKRQKK